MKHFSFLACVLLASVATTAQADAPSPELKACFAEQPKLEADSAYLSDLEASVVAGLGRTAAGREYMQARGEFEKLAAAPMSDTKGAALRRAALAETALFRTPEGRAFSALQLWARDVSKSIDEFRARCSKFESARNPVLDSLQKQALEDRGPAVAYAERHYKEWRKAFDARIDAIEARNRASSEAAQAEDRAKEAKVRSFNAHVAAVDKQEDKLRDLNDFLATLSDLSASLPRRPSYGEYVEYIQNYDSAASQTPIDHPGYKWGCRTPRSDFRGQYSESDLASWRDCKNTFFRQHVRARDQTREQLTEMRAEMKQRREALKEDSDDAE